MPDRNKKREQDFRKLIDKYVSGKASEQEIYFLELYYKEFENRADVLSGLDASEVNQIGDRIKNKIAGGVYVTERKDTKVVSMKRIWMRAAVVIGIVLTGAFAYYLIRGNETQSVIANNTTKQEQKSIIAPGGNKAILTLADGTKIILDSANNGAISKQGNVTVIKLNDGQLAYKPNKSTNQQINESTVLYNTISTPRGGQYQLVLSDGSKVWLNAASSIKFPNAFPGKDRKVEITGEAYFEVAASPDLPQQRDRLSKGGAKRPFIVEAGGMEVKVLGTHFNVNAYADESSIKTTLLEGSVKVIEGANSKTIIPGEQAQVSGNGTISTSQVDVDEVVAWKNGKFIFDNANIHSIMRQLEKWYDIDVEYQTANTGELFMGSISRNVNFSQILDMLEKTGSLRFEIVGRRVIVK